MSTQARFFKCALQVNPAGYIKYRGQQQTISEDEYNKELLKSSLDAGIEVIGLADHGSVNGVDKIRNLFLNNGIVVFPGFEIASSEKIHFVCLFDENKTSQELERILGHLDLLDPEDGILPTKLSATQLINKVNDINGFIYAAHCTNDNGVLNLRMNNVWTHEGLIAAQIPGNKSIEMLKEIANGFYRKVFQNKDPHYKRKRKMAAINSSDVAKPEDIKEPGASCLIKMTKPCFKSFKQAFLDADSRLRLNSDNQENYASTIENIRFVGGYLDAVNIKLSEHLNAVIGGRGTGKSTLLECIRYALDLSPKTTNAKKQHKSVIDTNLGQERGLVEITLRSSAMNGRRFKISRKYGSDPKVIDSQGDIAPYHPKDLLPNIEIYGQNEIYEMIRDEHSRNQLIERFLKVERAKFDRNIVEVLEKLENNRESIKQLLNQKNDIEAEVECLPKLLDQKTQYQALGIDEKLELIPKLEKEKQLDKKISQDIQVMQDAINAVQSRLPDTLYLSDAELDGLPHANLLQQQREGLNNLKTDVQNTLKKLNELTFKANQQVSSTRTSLFKRQNLEEQKLELAFRDIPKSQGKTGSQIGTEYQSILKQIEQIRPKKTSLEDTKTKISELQSLRKQMLLKLEQYTSERTASVLKCVQKLTKKLKKKINLTLQPEGGRQELVKFLNECNLESVGNKRLEWILEETFTPSSLAATIRLGKSEIERRFNTASSVVVSALTRLPEVKLMELEELQLPDTMAIKLNVAHGEQEAIFKPIDELSTGQQCTAVLHLLLLENQDPLILDQPEDNLDNAFIAERIVTELRKAKLSRQFLFATHNANIPIFGDAEWIGVLSVKDNKGLILPEQQGAIDVPNVQTLAADILEGGKSAFNQRREKYGFV